MSYFAIKYADNGGFGVMPDGYTFEQVEDEILDDNDEIVEVDIIITKTYDRKTKQLKKCNCPNCPCTKEK